MVDPRIQRYQVMEPLGQGAQGTTFRAIDRADGSEVAIKVFNLSKSADWKKFDLFERECRVLARLTHPNIPRFIDHYASPDSGDYFLVMELVQGRNLAALVKHSGPLVAKRLRLVFEQALEVLAYLQRQSPPIVHRDIKPSNLILSKDDTLHLIDFGSVRDLLRVEGGSTMIGTFGFMAPEQLHGEATTGTDLYALGATITALISASDPQDMPRKSMAIDLERIIPHHPWRPLLTQMLEPDADKRLSDANEALRQLRAIARRGSSATTMTDPGVDAKASGPSATPNSQGLRASPVNPALPVLQDDLRALAKSERRPLAVLIWLLSALASGGLTLVEAVFLPVFYKLLALTGFSRKSESALSEEAKQAQSAVREQRKTLSAIAQAAHPFRDDDESDQA